MINNLIQTDGLFPECLQQGLFNPYSFYKQGKMKNNATHWKNPHQTQGHTSFHIFAVQY